MTGQNRSGNGRIPGISPHITTGPGKTNREMVLRGVVRTGVERGSIVLVDDHGTPLAQLTGGDPTVLRDGLRVIVTGRFVTDLLTTAQQGAPFRVQTAVADPA